MATLLLPDPLDCSLAQPRSKSGMPVFTPYVAYTSAKSPMTTLPSSSVEKGLIFSGSPAAGLGEVKWTFTRFGH